MFRWHHHHVAAKVPLCRPDALADDDPDMCEFHRTECCHELQCKCIEVFYSSTILPYRTMATRKPIGASYFSQRLTLIDTSWHRRRRTGDVIAGFLLGVIVALAVHQIANL